MNGNVSAHNGDVVIGVDFGTLSGRAVVVSVADGAELAGAVHEFEHGVVSQALPGSDTPLAPDTALQVPADYRAVLRHTVPKALAAAGVPADRVVGIGTDFTACTVLPTTADGTPLCELPEFADRPHAYPKLWKHHAAQREADDINGLAEERGEPWLSRYGGKISSEWQFAKGLQVLREDPEVYRRTERWIEAADWIVWVLCGSETRNVCTAGYKGIHQDGAWPDRDYLAALHPGFAGFAEEKLAHPLMQLGDRAGGLSAAAAALTGLPEGIAVSVGNVDAHVTAAAAQTVEPGRMLAVMGTSTCHVMNGASFAEVPGMCGAVKDGIAPGYWGYEAGQSGVGDVFAWFAEGYAPAEYRREADELGISVHDLLSRKAADQPVGAHGLVALDWHSGNRSVLVDHDLSGVLCGLTLATRPEEVYRALVESTAFGTRTILDAFAGSGVPVEEFTVAGGLKRNAFVLQIYADVLNRPLAIAHSDQGPALGSAIHAAVAAGAYPDIRTASAAMGGAARNAVLPDPDRAAAYDRLYAVYTELHDHFGRGGSDALHTLRTIRNESLAD
ncbi:ribulokinase [Streptomonospora halophila]|uniref:Ribulokinase n=1 Tax=Streptomonospora halophila TaxID=427369 RepID=A0ABP9H660_9ACTN